MRDISILHDLLKKQCPNLHSKRLSSLMIATQSLLDGQQLSLTKLGQNISGSVAPKHNIKHIDILLLIAMLAEWLLRLLGLIAQKQNWEGAKDYKMNSVQIIWIHKEGRPIL